MAKGAYIGVDNVARKIKKGYIGVDGVARKIKKAYIGVGGVARPCWGGGKVVYYGTAPSISTAARYLAFAKIGNCALIGGGLGKGTRLSTVNTYDRNLTKGTATNLAQGRAFAGGQFNSAYALFAGGTSGVWSSCVASIDAYNASLTRFTAPELSVKRVGPRGRSLPNHAIYHGGSTMGGYTAETSVDAYDTSLVKTKLTLNTDSKIGGGSVGKYAIFLTPSATHVYDDETLTRTDIAQCGITSGMCALSMGDYNLNTNNDGAVAYDKNLTRTTADGLATTVSSRSGACVGGNGLVACSWNGSEFLTTVEVYDSGLTRTIAENGLSAKRNDICGADNGKFALFAGGYTSSNKADGSPSNVVDAYTVV